MNHWQVEVVQWQQQGVDRSMAEGTLVSALVELDLYTDLDCWPGVVHCPDLKHQRLSFQMSLMHLYMLLEMIATIDLLPGVQFA